MNSSAAQEEHAGGGIWSTLRFVEAEIQAELSAAPIRLAALKVDVPRLRPSGLGLTLRSASSAAVVALGLLFFGLGATRFSASAVSAPAGTDSNVPHAAGGADAAQTELRPSLRD
jgi:hypothetical protein